MKEKTTSNNIDLSIIIPHYNTPDLLNRLLNTIPVRENIQVIVVDDRSTKDLDKFEICKQEHPEVMFLKNETEKKGCGTARNIGMKEAKGNWYLFSDADDILVDGWYESVSLYFDSDNDIVYFPPTSIKTDGSSSDRHIEFANFANNYLKKPDNRKNELELRYRFTIACSKLYRKNIVDQLNLFWEEVPYSEDVMFSVQIAYYANNIEVCNKPIYCIMEYPNSLSSQGNDESSESMTGVLIRRYQFLKSHLSKKDFRLLDLSALGRLVLSFRCKSISTKSKWKVLRMVLDAHMRIIPRRIFTVSFWRNRFKK